MPLARAELESLLRTRRLDRTLTTALPPVTPAGTTDEAVVAATGIAALDARLGGGFPRGHLSEITGPRSSGRTSLLLQTLSAATARGELVALVDALDMLDVESAAAAGIDLTRLLWIRGHVVVNPGLCRDLNQRALEQAVRAFSLVLQAGNFGVVAFDVGEAPSDAIRRLPFTTWLRLQRQVEAAPTSAVLVGPEPMARSSAGVTVKLGRAEGAGLRAGLLLFDGFDIDARIVAARWRPELMRPAAPAIAPAVPANTRSVNAPAPVKGIAVGARDAAAPASARSVNAPAPLKVMREGHGPSASGVGVGPHALKEDHADLRVRFSTTCV